MTDESGWTTKTTKKVTKHVTRTVTQGGQEIKFKEAHSFANDEPVEQNFMLNGNLFHVEGIKRFKAKATKEGFDISTDAGKVSIKCPNPTAYFVYKDEDGKIAARVMTQEEIDEHSTKLPKTK